LDTADRTIINALQGGFPVSDRPFADVARTLGLSEDDLIERIARLCDNGTLTRFGPMYNAERLGGDLSLAAMSVPASDFERVAEVVNDFPEVAHNYAREHKLNMWFVLATETPERVQEVIAEIERQSGYRIYNMPKLDEYFIGLRFDA
jgi:DNA-binding Lrp family transcriptional regulator